MSDILVKELEAKRFHTMALAYDKIGPLTKKDKQKINDIIDVGDDITKYKDVYSMYMVRDQNGTKLGLNAEDAFKFHFGVDVNDLKIDAVKFGFKIEF
jgi:hypothetical protein